MRVRFNWIISIINRVHQQYYSKQTTLVNKFLLKKGKERKFYFCRSAIDTSDTAVCPKLSSLIMQYYSVFVDCSINNNIILSFTTWCCITGGCWWGSDQDTTEESHNSLRLHHHAPATPLSSQPGGAAQVPGADNTHLTHQQPMWSLLMIQYNSWIIVSICVDKSWVYQLTPLNVCRLLLLSVEQRIIFELDETGVAGHDDQWSVPVAGTSPHKCSNDHLYSSGWPENNRDKSKYWLILIWK